MNVSNSAPTDSRQIRAKGLRKRWPIVILVVILVLAGAAAIMAAQGAFQNMMNSSSLPETQFDAMPSGAQVDLVFEITSVPSDKQLVGNFLEPASNGVYHRTTDTLNISVASDTKIVMGQTSDVRPGAVLQIRGLRIDEHSVTAQSIVILTGYVTVQ